MELLVMSGNQSLDNTSTSPSDSLEFSLPHIARFWILLPSDIISIFCTLIVFIHVLINRKARRSVKNHVLVAMLVFDVGIQIIDIPLYLNFIVHSIVFPTKTATCLIWVFTDIGLYNGGTILMAWMAFERHIIVFHDQWILTRKRRIIAHYIPLSFLILYILIFYIYSTYFPPCQDAYDFTLPVCGASLGYGNGFMWIWDS
ncbi:unnamed protein product, partial [Rotaria sp. Silwood2]